MENEEEYKDVNPLKFIFWMFIFPALFGGGCGELLELFDSFM